MPARPSLHAFYRATLRRYTSYDDDMKVWLSIVTGTVLVGIGLILLAAVIAGFRGSSQLHLPLCDVYFQSNGTVSAVTRDRQHVYVTGPWAIALTIVAAGGGAALIGLGAVTSRSRRRREAERQRGFAVSQSSKSR
jgi:threonine/homoserine/homoserine lactone efflux protein